MPNLADIKATFTAINDTDLNRICIEILESLPDDSHDGLLKTRLKAVADKKTKADLRLKQMFSVTSTVTDDNLRMAYKEYGDEMRHFSTVRSALTTFLVTVALAACSAYFNRSQTHPFLLAAAIVFAAAAVAVCLEFSRRTSKAYLRRKRIWKHYTAEAIVTRLDHNPEWHEVGKAMLGDATNYILLIGLGSIVAAFLWRDALVLPALPVPPVPPLVL